MRGAILGAPLAFMGLAAAVAFNAVACSGSTMLVCSCATKQNAADVSEGISLDVEGEVSDAASTGGVATYTDAPAVGNLGLTVPLCTITRAPSSPTDTDGDGVPDSVSLTINGCVLTYPGAGGAFAETDTLLGTIIVKDPTPTTADHNVERTYQQVSRIRERVGSSTVARSTEMWTGTRVMTRDSSSLMQVETGFITQFGLPDGSTPTHKRTWTSKFTADTAGSIKADKPLPSGTWSITGTGTWTIGPSTYNVTVSTTVPLHYNAGCTATPPFDSGVLKVAMTQGTGTGTVTITFTPCGTAIGYNS
ncbi:MAG TPA: hypothetical protein VN848_06275 [Gemmatimonadales bacterium]|nr:hypothetical protein [Gemmatimonadales bacterium]